jgi:hypothetical protein
MKHIRYIFIALVIPLLIGGHFASAETVSIRTCADVAALSARTVAGITERSLALQKSRPEILDAISRRWAQQDMVRVRTMDFGPLELSLANGTENQKLALEVFKTALENASKERQLAIDVANNNFRASIRNMLQARSEGIHRAAGEFAASVRSSLSDATVGCVAGSSLTNVRMDVESRLQSARQKFEADTEVSANGPNGVRRLTVQHKANISAATLDFKAKVTAAQAAFKAALDR